jgi:hypothetical protein
MVNFDIFKSAFDIYQSGDVFFLSATEHSARFMVRDVEVRMEITATGTKFNCNCEHHMRHQLQDKLCKRVIAVILYIYFRRGKLI